MEEIKKFGERLSELVFDAKISTKTLATAVEVNVTMIRRWIRGISDISLSNLIKLSDYFRCPIDCIAGRSENHVTFSPQTCPPFYDRLREVMDRNAVTRYRLVKDTSIYDSYFTNWKCGADIQLSTLCLLADYFDCSIDYLVGREK